MDVYLEIVSGPDAGRRLTLPDGISTIGRSGGNSFLLKDPLLSRRHCQLVRHGSKVEIADLDSANGTYLNGSEISISPLKNGDEVVIGETHLVMHLPSANDSSESTSEVLSASKSSSSASAPLVDLGFDTATTDDTESPARPNWRPMLWAIAAAAIIAVATSFILRSGKVEKKPEIAKPAEESPLPLVINYEKIEASSENIFRYGMTLSPSRLLAIEIDDLAEDRHVRKETTVSEESALRLAKRLERVGLQSLEAIPAGISPDGDLLRRSLCIVCGRRVVTATVENRTIPDAFANICDILETFGRNELGIWAIQYPTEKLIELASECHTRAVNLFEQRGIAHGNIFDAVKACREGVFYLETVEPKPDFYGDLLSTMRIAEEELERRYEEQRFKADRAINLKDWRTAAEELRILREQIPDAEDERNADATRKLLDVENRLRSDSASPARRNK